MAMTTSSASPQIDSIVEYIKSKEKMMQCHPATNLACMQFLLQVGLSEQDLGHGDMDAYQRCVGILLCKDNHAPPGRASHFQGSQGISRTGVDPIPGSLEGWKPSHDLHTAPS